MNSVRDALWSSEAPPGSEAALDRTVQAAVADVEARAGRMGRTLTRVVAVAATVALLAGATPQGRDAVSWAGELVGIGDVGGPPASNLSGQTPVPATQALVLATGLAPTGEAFEVFTYGTADAGWVGAATCVRVELVSSGLSPGTTCFRDGPPEAGITLGDFSHADQLSYGMLTGQVQPEARRVTVEYTDADGRTRVREATVARFSDDVVQRLGSPNPTAVFVAFLPGTTTPGAFCAPGVTVSAFDRTESLLATARPCPGQ